MKMLILCVLVELNKTEIDEKQINDLLYHGSQFIGCCI